MCFGIYSVIIVFKFGSVCEILLRILSLQSEDVGNVSKKVGIVQCHIFILVNLMFQNCEYKLNRVNFSVTPTLKTYNLIIKVSEYLFHLSLYVQLYTLYTLFEIISRS